MSLGHTCESSLVSVRPVYALASETSHALASHALSELKPALSNFLKPPDCGPRDVLPDGVLRRPVSHAQPRTCSPPCLAFASPPNSFLPPRYYPINAFPVS